MQCNVSKPYVQSLTLIQKVISGHRVKNCRSVVGESRRQRLSSLTISIIMQCKLTFKYYLRGLHYTMERKTISLHLSAPSFTFYIVLLYWWWKTRVHLTQRTNIINMSLWLQSKSQHKTTKLIFLWFFWSSSHLQCL